MLVASVATGLITSSIFEAASLKSGVRSPAKISPSRARPEAVSALGDIDRHVAEHTELHQSRIGVAINDRVTINLNVNSRFVFWFVGL